MKPSAKEIIDGISWVLDDRVAPQTTDKWASSYLRSIKGLLAHLSVRVENEGEILWEDLADQRELLTGIAERLGETKVWRELAGKIVKALDKKWRQQGNYPTIESLEAENLAYRTLIEQLVTAVHDDVADWPNEEKDALHGQLVDYLNRQMAREKILYREPFSGLPF